MTTSPDIRTAALDELDHRKHLRALEDRTDTKQVRSGIEIGHTGLEVFGGVLSGDIVEHNRDWMGDKRFKIVDRMRRGDATCAAAQLALTLPILSTDVHIEARAGSSKSKPDAAVQKAADFVEEVLFGDHMERTWDGWLREALLHFAYGHYPFEKVFSELETGEFAGAMGWREFAPRHPSTFTEWLFDSNGRLITAVQEATDMATGTRERIELPADKLLMFTHQEEAGNPLGQSIFRPAYKHWKFKDGFYAVQAIAVERQGAGTPFAQYPIGTADADVDKAEEMLQNIQAHEQSYVTFAEDWEVGFLDMGASSVLDPMKAIEHHDHMIVKSIMAGFLNLPQDGRGSYALSSDSSGFFNFTLQHAADHIAAVLNRKAIPQLVEYNFPGLPSYPHVRFNRVGQVGIDRVIEGLSQLAREGVLTPDVGLENTVRDLLNLPPVDEADFEEAKEEAEEPEVED